MKICKSRTEEAPPVATDEEKLDKVLFAICSGLTNVNGKEWFTTEISKKLIADGLIEVVNQTSRGEIIDVAATERGRAFSFNGGYTFRKKEDAYRNEEREARKKDMCSQKWNRWLSFSAIAVSALCALAQLIVNCNGASSLTPHTINP